MTVEEMTWGRLYFKECSVYSILSPHCNPCLRPQEPLGFLIHLTTSQFLAKSKLILIPITQRQRSPRKTAAVSKTVVGFVFV
jgi:hypothetical protein